MYRSVSALSNIISSMIESSFSNNTVICNCELETVNFSQASVQETSSSFNVIPVPFTGGSVVLQESNKLTTLKNRITILTDVKSPLDANNKNLLINYGKNNYQSC